MPVLDAMRSYGPKPRRIPTRYTGGCGAEQGDTLRQRSCAMAVLTAVLFVQEMFLERQDSREPSNTAPAAAATSAAASTPVPSTQTTLFNAGLAEATELAQCFAGLKERIETKISLVKDGTCKHRDLQCPITSCFTPVAPDPGSAGSTEWSQCMVCKTIVKGGFPKRVMHLLGNTKLGGGAGYRGDLSV